MLNFELKPSHYWRRVRKVCAALGITAKELDGRLHILNLRGKPFSLDRLQVDGYDLIVIDPLYKLLASEGTDESDVSGVSRVLGKIDAITAKGCAVEIVHHATKGRAGDRQAIDRGSGTGILARDFDGAFTLTPHQDHNREWFVLETILRNYAWPDAITLEFSDGLFTVRTDVPPVVETTLTAKRRSKQGFQLRSCRRGLRSGLRHQQTAEVADRIRSEFSVGRDKRVT